MFPHFDQSEYAIALKNAYRQFPAKGSTLDLDFINNRSRVAGVYGTALAAATTTRSTTSTYWDSAGVLQTAAINEPIFEYDPILRRPLGLRILGQSRNEYTNSATLSTQSVAVTEQPYTISFVGTGTIALSGVSTAGPLVGIDDNTRVSLTFTPTSGTLVSTVSGTVSNAQLQAGNIFDSYIPTGASAETRAADVISFSGAYFSSWYNQAGGTLIVTGMYSDVSRTGLRLICLDTGAASPGIRISGGAFQILNAAGAVQANLNPASISSMAPFTLAAGYSEDDVAAAGGGVLLVDSSASIPVVDRMFLLSSSVLPSQGGYIQRITYFPQRLPNNILQYLGRPS